MIGPGRDPQEFSLEIDGKEWRFWADAEWTTCADGFDVVSFSAPFDPEAEQYRQAFRPFGYRPMKLKLGGEAVFTGFIMNVTPSVTATDRRVDVDAYASAAVMGDSMVTASTLPLEFEKNNLQQIASRLCYPFSLYPTFAADAGAPFDRVKLEPTEKPLDLLIDLAKQRGLVIRSDADGNPVFCKSASGPAIPRSFLNGNAQPVVSVTPNFQPQGYYSEITGCAKPKSGRPGGTFTVSNQLWKSPIARPFYVELDDTEPADVPTAVKARLGRMFATCVSYTVELATMLDQNGAPWKADTFVSLVAPDAMIYRQTTFLIASATLRSSGDSRSAKLELVLPGAYSGEAPTSLPWDV